MSDILKKYESMKDTLGSESTPQPKITDSYKSKDKTPYTVGISFDNVAKFDEPAVARLEKERATKRYLYDLGGGYKGAQGYNDKNKYGG